MKVSQLAIITIITLIVESVMPHSTTHFLRRMTCPIQRRPELFRTLPFSATHTPCEVEVVIDVAAEAMGEKMEFRDEEDQQNPRFIKLDLWRKFSVPLPEVRAPLASDVI
jgi:hypothetical protein